MELWKRIAAALMLYMLTSCSAEVSSNHLKPRSVVKPGSRLAETASANMSNGGTYAWSEWGAWSPCSRTCGGGVSVQERHCLSSDKNRWVRRKRRRLPPGHERQIHDNYFKNPTNEPNGRAQEISAERRSNDGARQTSSGLQLNITGNSTEVDARTLKKEVLGDNDMNDIRRVTDRRIRRDTRNVELGCRGLSKRYHECNTAPCGGPVREPRAEQCSYYDRRPFKGRFYTWVPYHDAEFPCALTCRPRGQHFYASLGLVSDGTPCTRPGFRAICVQGSCKVVGREGVLSTSTSRDPRCGRRLVSGLFTRPRLPLGYSHIATVPPGACRLNVSELVPSENYIALKVTNGSFIMNGEFAVSSPGTYEAAGAQFVYRRSQGVEIIYTLGPTMQSLDIMILYQHPNPSIKYEYLTDTLPDEAIGADISPETVPAGSTHHQRRHHGSDAHTKSLSTPNQKETPNDTGARRFSWKILVFHQCSRTCGGGIQLGKFKCIEEGNNREVSPVHCNTPAPAARRRRCNVGPCPPRWRTTAWSTCPSCGPATQIRNVGCVQDHSRGLTKISDSKCSLPRPFSSQVCDIPNCESNVISETRGQDTRRQVHDKDHTERFHAAPDRPPLSRPYNRTDRIETENDITAVLGPEYFSAAGGWLYTEWSECVGWCVGGGVQTRLVKCDNPAGCTASRAPVTYQSCVPRSACKPNTAHWFTGDWSPCSAECGGRQVRGVVCLGGASKRARESSCSEPKPPSERSCGNKCEPTWYLSDWSSCTGVCGAGVQSRTVWCARVDSSSTARESECTTARPHARRACDLPKCEPSATPAPAPAAVPQVSRAGPVHSQGQVPHQYTPYQPPKQHAPYNPPPQQFTTPDPQRIPRNQDQNPRPFGIQQDNGKSVEGCTDRLSSCLLAVQARLCPYYYYSYYCCRSCGSANKS